MFYRPAGLLVVFSIMTMTREMVSRAAGRSMKDGYFTAFTICQWRDSEDVCWAKSAQSSSPNNEGGVLFVQCTDGPQLTIKGAPDAPESPHYMEVIGIPDSNQSIGAEI